MQNWTEPVLSPKNPQPSDIKKEWRVRFKYFHAGKWYAFSFARDVNRIHIFRDRLKEINDLKEALIHKMKFQYWNPVTDTFQPPLYSADKTIAEMKDFTFEDAIEFAYNKKLSDWNEKSASDYRSTKKYLLQAARGIGLNRTRMSTFELPHYRTILDQAEKDRKLSPAGYNKYREHLGTFVSEMKQWNIVKHNDAYEVKTKIEHKNFAHRPGTKDQVQIIINKLREVNHNYYVFICIEYGCTLRPKEIQGLQIKDFHKKDGVFHLRSNNAKTKIERDVTIPMWLMDELMKLNLHAYPPDYYIFSANNRHASFLPGPQRAGRNMSTRTWKKIVKDPVKDGGLGMDVTQYSFKKLSGNEMVKVQRKFGMGDILALPRMQMGHTDSKQTEEYVTEHLEVMKDLIKNHLPAL
jgi:integrase